MFAPSSQQHLVVVQLSQTKDFLKSFNTKLISLCSFLPIGWADCVVQLTLLRLFGGLLAAPRFRSTTLCFRDEATAMWSFILYSPSFRKGKCDQILLAPACEGFYTRQIHFASQTGNIPCIFQVLKFFYYYWDLIYWIEIRCLI